MKTIITLVGILLFTASFAQQNALKNDIIITADGQLLQVKVVKVTDDAISFNYPGEGVINEIKPGKINKIVFASGRTQNFGGKKSASNNVGTAMANAPEASGDSNDFLLAEESAPELPSYEEGLLSVVPIDFQRNGAYDKNLASAATKHLIGLMSNESSSQKLQVQPMSTSIEKLIDSGFNYSKLRKSSPEELRGALGAEYLMFVTIEESEKGVATDNDLLSSGPSSKKSAELVRNVNIKIYGTEGTEEAFETNFSESVFVNNGTSSTSLLASGKWKSSLRYLTEQIYDSGTFVE